MKKALEHVVGPVLLKSLSSSSEGCSSTNVLSLCLAAAVQLSDMVGATAEDADFIRGNTCEAPVDMRHCGTFEKTDFVDIGMVNLALRGKNVGMQLIFWVRSL